MTPDELLAGLDAEQRKAVLATRGPVCIIAGAGTGKTRTITHRIAYAVATGQVPSEQILAVTHSQKAAGEMRARLRQLGVGDVVARTFHAAALKQLKYFWDHTGRGGQPQLLESRYTLVRRILENHPAGRTGKAGVASELVLDVSSEIGWAKSSLVTPRAYPATAVAARRSLPIGAKELGEVYASYEKAKTAAGRIDFEDMLQMTADLILANPEVAAEVRATYSYFLVDEYQDVDPLQQYLLDAWVGDRDDLCIVGDPNQSIYGFRGSEPGLILDFPKKYPKAELVRLVKDYRSTPQVVALANKVSCAPRATALVGQQPDGPQPTAQALDDEGTEEAWVAKKIKDHLSNGVPAHEIAVLYRFNAQSARFEQALSAAGIPYNVVDTEKFFDRPEVRNVLIEFGKCAREEPEEVGVYLMRLVLAEAGWDRDNPPGGAGAMRDRWEALMALLSTVESMPDNEYIPAGDLLVELQHRAMESHIPSLSTVQLSTIHKAKGLEWDVTFVVRCSEGSIPSTYAKTDKQVEEEKNLLYVAVTRARHHLHLTYAKKRENGWNIKPSRFLVDLNMASQAQRRPTSSRSDQDPASTARRAPVRTQADQDAQDRRKFGTCAGCDTIFRNAQSQRLGRCGGCLTGDDALYYQKILVWREQKARSLKTLPIKLLDEHSILALVADRPKDIVGLGRIPGIDLVKRRTWGKDLLGHLTS